MAHYCRTDRLSDILIGKQFQLDKELLHGKGAVAQQCQLISLGHEHRGRQ
jgi:hypothetical protein